MRMIEANCLERVELADKSVYTRFWSRVKSQSAMRYLSDLPNSRLRLDTHTVRAGSSAETNLTTGDIECPPARASGRTG